MQVRKESIMAKQVTITKKQENKGANGILDLTGQISQVLKQFDGIYGTKLPDTDGLTVETWMEAHGVPRFVTPKGVKKGYTPGLVNAAWADEMLSLDKDGKVSANYTYRNVAGKVQLGEDPTDPYYRVYPSEEEALKEHGKSICVYKLVEVPKNRWSVKTILTGLMQTRDYAKHHEKSEKSIGEWEALEHVYIVQTNDEGQRYAVEVSKHHVVF